MEGSGNSPKRPENENLDDLSQCPVCERKFIVFTKKGNCLGCGKGYCTKYVEDFLVLLVVMLSGA